MRLISFSLCPFVQRALTVAKAKGIEVDIEYIDLANKPEWFLKLSPLGKVPVLEVDGEVVFESTVIAEYLDDIKAPSLHPSDPLKRAHNRAWIEFSSGILFGLYVASSAESKEKYDELIQDVNKKLAQLNAQLKNKPFFNGTQAALIDFAYAPLFMRIEKLENIKPLHLLDDLPALQAWSKAILALPAVQAATVDDYDKLFREMLTKKGSWMVA